MHRGFNGNVAADGYRRQGRGVRAVLHVDVVVWRRHRAHLHVYPGTQPVEDVRTASGETPEGWASEGCDRAVGVEELPLQPSGESRPRRPAGVSVPAGERWAGADA